MTNYDKRRFGLGRQLGYAFVTNRDYINVMYNITMMYMYKYEGHLLEIEIG